MTDSALAATGPWTSTNDLPTAGSWYGQYDGAVLLNTKEVLLVGGADGKSAALDQIALFDTVTKKWTATGRLKTARRLHTTTVLDDGRVLVAGGIGGAGLSPGLSAAELYDPVKKTWSTTGTMIEGRWGHSAVLLADKTVLVAGGTALRSGTTVRALNSAEIYDPQTGKWAQAKPMTDDRTGHSALRFKDGRVLVCGGTTPIADGVDAALAFCELYNPAGPSWSPTGSLTEPRSRHQAVPLSDTRALILGGRLPGGQGDGTYDPFARLTAERYDLATGTWTATKPRPGGRGLHRAVPLGSGRVLVIGGTGDGRDDVGYQSVLIYDSGTQTWSAAGGLITGRWAFAATALSGTEVLVTGGTVASGLAPADPETDELTKTSEIFTVGSGS